MQPQPYDAHARRAGDPFQLKCWLIAPSEPSFGRAGGHSCGDLWPRRHVHVRACVAIGTHQRIHNGEVDAIAGTRTGAWLHRHDTRQVAGEMRAGLGLPVGIGDGACATPNVLVIPLPRFGIDGLAYRAEDT